MSGFDSNPFVHPVDVNPFQDPSVTQVTTTGTEGLQEFNPFSARALDDLSGPTIPVSAPSQPAVLQPTVEPSPRAVAAAAQEELRKQQEELEKKAAELQRKEEELHNRDTSRGKENNWPPLPKFLPIKPCFYQDFNEEIPVDYQKICKRMYYLWMYHCVTLFLNVLACMAYFIADAQFGVDFGLSILWFLLFSPGAFLCWYRPVYKAFSGWISSISMLGTSKAVAVFMMVVAGFFTVNAVLAITLLKMVHSKYRRTGASFQKAQQEFSQGVVTNNTFQTAASSAAASAVQGAFR
ncbi:secretory carrier membrane protein 2, like isoform X2 [Hoplias malabaricus]|uniref:secretory carrier membrane protein 2, like isoform X2 n=1 Tax=Hoplias malabaricus TaxID=27720 RepID=UPI0034627767